MNRYVKFNFRCKSFIKLRICACTETSNAEVGSSQIKNSGSLSTNPMLRFVDISSRDRSLAIIVGGLPEYELIENDRRTVAITLLRAITNGRADPDQEVPQMYGSQCQGKYTFRYAVYPHKGRGNQSNVIEEA